MPLLGGETPYLPHLEDLKIKTMERTDFFFAILGDDTQGDDQSQLTSLSYSANLLRAPLDTAHVLEHPRLQSLTNLELLGAISMDVSDADIDRLLALKNLQRLHLDSAQITGVGLKNLVMGSKGVLKSLTLTACDNIGHDAVEWAARQGVEVVVLSHANGSKIVRR